MSSFVTQPNMYARGILFGKMKYELGDHATVKCPETGMEADIEFKVKGWVGGGYNAIAGFIKNSQGKNLYELSGHWHEQMFIKDLANGKKELLFDAAHAKPSFPKSRPLNEQAPRESQRLWHNTTQAIKKADQKVATDEKSKIEDEQRREAAERGETAWKPKLFRPAPAGDEQNLDWIIDAEVDANAPIEKQIHQILAIAPILPGQGNNEQIKQESASPSEQGKPLPQQQTQGGGDLIDFGQGDATSDSKPAVPAALSSGAAAGAPSGLQQPLQPTQSRQSKPGDLLRRMDSTGGEDVFMDAES